MTTIPGHPMIDPLGTGQMFGVDTDHVAGALSFVALRWLLGFQVPEPAKPQGVHHPPDSGKGRLEGLGDAAERAALAPQIPGLLQMLRFERPQLGAANTSSICQCRMTALSELCQSLVGIEQADLGFSNKGLDRNALIEEPANQAFPTDRCQ